LLEGNSEKEVAARLGVSPTTIHQYVTALYRHFGVRSRAQLLSQALQQLGPEYLDVLLSATDSGPALLSPRLQATLVCLLEGDSEKGAAARLGLSPSTLHQYVTALYRRFGVASRAQLLGQVLRRVNAGGGEQLLQRLVGGCAHAPT
jgi:DNA-binding NarL/FixJ family response regulator